MKRLFSLLIVIALMISCMGCQGNYAQMDLREPIAIPENGIVEKDLLEEVKSENAIVTFVGESSDIKYEWTIFGTDLSTTRDINLLVDLEETKNGIKISFIETNDFGFPALLSLHLNEKWNADSANAYVNDDIAYSVSISGSKTSILNISINKNIAECVVIPDVTEVVINDTSSENGHIENKKETNKIDSYLSGVTSSDDREYSDGSSTTKDKYDTDPVPEGKPLPVEPEDQEVNDKKAYTCTISIECSTILNNLDKLNPNKLELIPSNGVILPATKVTFYEGESVYDVLQRACKENGIHLESSWTPTYNSAYIEGIHNLYEFDCGELSGWMYRVNGWYPNYGCSRYQLADGEKIEWRYTCDLGKDIGCDWMQ